MEAARIAAARGHAVTLYEKGGSLGGLLDFASNVKGPHENLADFKAYLEKQLELNGVNVVLNHEVDAAFIDAGKPDAVILAAGGLRDSLAVKGGSVPVIDFTQFMTTEMGENVVVYGSNAQAFDCALWLTVHKQACHDGYAEPSCRFGQAAVRACEGLHDVRAVRLGAEGMADRKHRERGRGGGIHQVRHGHRR